MAKDEFTETVYELLLEGLGVEDIALELGSTVERVRVIVGLLRYDGRLTFGAKRNPPSREK